MFFRNVLDSESSLDSLYLAGRRSIFRGAYFYEIMDLMLISAEIPCMASIPRHHPGILTFCSSAWFSLSIRGDTLSFNRWSTRQQMFLVGFSYVQVVGLCLLWVFRVAAFFKSGGRKLLQPFDLQSGCDDEMRERSWLLVCFGKGIWCERYR